MPRAVAKFLKSHKSSMILRRRYIVCSWVLFLGLYADSVFGQSKMAGVFENFRRTGDKAALLKELSEAEDSGIDLRVEIPVLLNIISYGDGMIEQTAASSEVCALAYMHAGEVDEFRPAIQIFERHLSDKKGDVPWGLELVMLHAILGLQPDAQTLALIYEMTGDISIRAQGLALAALGRVKPLPKKAKDLFRSRIPKQEGKVSGAPILESMEYALPDPDVIKMIATSAEGNDFDEQRAATRILARMNQMPLQVVEVFRRLQGRGELDQIVAASVRAAVDRIDRVPPMPDKP
jgi:hypothetical protein